MNKPKQYTYRRTVRPFLRDSIRFTRLTVTEAPRCVACNQSSPACSPLCPLTRRPTLGAIARATHAPAYSQPPRQLQSLNCHVAHSRQPRLVIIIIIIIGSDDDEFNDQARGSDSVYIRTLLATTSKHNNISSRPQQENLKLASSRRI